jgi:hypothetical protein
MKHIRIFFVLLIAAFTSFQLDAQNVKFRSNIGFAGYADPFDGYFFSFDIGIPIIKSLELDPSFSFYSDVKEKNISYIWNEFDHETTINKDIGGSLAGDMQLFINVNPFQWTKNVKLNKVDFGMGIGYGIKIFSDYYYAYNNNVTSIITTSGFKGSLSAKMFYNYHIKKCFIGIIIGVKDLNDEGVSILGLQFGVNIK